MASHRAKDTRPTILDGSEANHPRHSALAYVMRRQVLRIVASIIAAILVFVGTIALATWINFDTVIHERSTSFIGESEAVDPNAGKPIQLVIIGQDSRDGGNAELSGDGSENAGVHNADTTMVAEISANRDFINLVSIPRDSLVSVPSCETTNGTIPAQENVMFNSIFSTAYTQADNLASAATCTVKAVNALTGLHISNFVVVDFKGLADMIDAVGGVDICIPVHTVDANTNMDLQKGMHHLDGVAATNYARMRYGTGTDGSDIMRTTRQQYLIKSLLNEAISKNLLTETSQLYQLALAAISSLNISEGMANASALVGLAMSLRNMPLNHLYTQTVPIVQSELDPNRVEWAASADEVWAKFKADKPLFGSDDTTTDTNNQQSSDDTTSSDDATSEPTATDTATEEPSESTDDTHTSEPTTPSTPTPTVDPVTGLIKEADGTLIDPETGGIVDPETGAIKDQTTNQYVGIAYQYLNNTVCAVPAKEN